jgi:hypothetical protein
MDGVFFETGDSGLTAVDPIERHRYALSTPKAVAPEPADTTQFRFPVDTAVSIRTDAISLPNVVLAYVRDRTGTILAQAEHFAYEELPEGRYTIELSASMKLYLRVESSLTVSADTEGMDIDFGSPTEVVVGARSHHDRPAATVTTTSDPADMMKAISTFGSALKTTSPERSYPTLRGHPPTVELGTELDCAGLDAPETGVTIEIPREYRSIFVVAPLAYYLGARVVPGEQPLVRTDEGFVHRLDGPAGFERTVERTLKQVFFLDCLTRTEGVSPVELHERRMLDGELGLDFAELYDASLAEQFETYLSVPFEAVESQIPEWKLTTHVEPTPTSVEMLPFVVDDLAIVHSPRAQEVSVSNVWTAALDEFLRGDSTRSASAQPSGDSTYVQPTTSDSLEQAWVGEGTPLGASKATVDAYRNRLDRTPTDGDIDITVVCNDAAMDEERNFVDEMYDDRLPFAVTVERDLTTAELETVLTSRTDFFHYIGHIDSAGFQCVDGKLDAATLDSVGVSAFLLNACQSYRQGMALIESGAIGGIVTLSDVLNRDAVTMGRAFAGLLNCGFPLRAVLEIARDESIVGGQYIVVGDGGFTIAHAEGGTPNICEIERVGESFRVEQRTYPTTEQGLGSLFVPRTSGETEYYLSSGTIRTVELSARELHRFLERETIPVKIEGELYWSDRLDRSECYGPG